MPKSVDALEMVEVKSIEDTRQPFLPPDNSAHSERAGPLKVYKSHPGESQNLEAQEN